MTAILAVFFFILFAKILQNKKVIVPITSGLSLDSLIGNTIRVGIKVFQDTRDTLKITTFLIYMK